MYYLRIQIHGFTSVSHFPGLIYSGILISSIWCFNIPFPGWYSFAFWFTSYILSSPRCHENSKISYNYRCLSELSGLYYSAARCRYGYCYKSGLFNRLTLVYLLLTPGICITTQTSVGLSIYQQSVPVEYISYEIDTCTISFQVNVDEYRILFITDASTESLCVKRAHRHDRASYAVYAYITYMYILCWRFDQHNVTSVYTACYWRRLWTV
jgi:hypothetical protein